MPDRVHRHGIGRPLKCVIFTLLTGIAAALFALSGVSYADDTFDLKSELAVPHGEQCVEPTEVMRRRHMEFLNRHRDDVVIDGIRTEKYSLQKCLNCHVRRTASGEFPRHTDSAHFCAACHEFSSVNIDCFSCHADRPSSFYRGGAGQTKHTDSHAPGSDD